MVAAAAVLRAAAERSEHPHLGGRRGPHCLHRNLLDPSSFRFASEANYLNHPSPYYLLLARLGPNLEGHPEAILVHRLFNVALAAIGESLRDVEQDGRARRIGTQRLDRLGERFGDGHAT